MDLRVRLAATAFALLATACDSSTACTASVEPGLLLDIRDATTNAPIAEGTTGTVTDGAYSDSLVPWGNDASGIPLTLAAAHERPGTYEVWVERAGYQPTTFVTPHIGSNECHVETLRLSVSLSPSPG